MSRKQTLFLILIFLFLSIGLILLLESFIRKDVAFTPALNSANEKMISSSTPNPIPSIVISPAPSPSPSSCEEIPATTAYATITIQTDRKTKTFDIYPDVEETTLDQHIGHLPSSSNPGQFGLCVLMGHRDKELKILKYAKAGDVFTVKKNGTQYRFSVTRIKIQDNEDELVFPVTNSVGLAIVTCYPFDFLGTSPQRVIFFCKLV